LKVDSSRKVVNLNADEVDELSVEELVEPEAPQEFAAKQEGEVAWHSRAKNS
jgi:hypothetical protein